MPTNSPIVTFRPKSIKPLNKLLDLLLEQGVSEIGESPSIEVIERKAPLLGEGEPSVDSIEISINKNEITAKNHIELQNILKEIINKNGYEILDDVMITVHKSGDIASYESIFSRGNVVYLNNKEARPTAPNTVPDGDDNLGLKEAGTLTLHFQGALNRAAMTDSLHAVMNERNLSVRKAAEQAGVGAKMIQRIMTGDTSIDKSIEVLEKLGCSFEVRVSTVKPTDPSAQP